MVGERPMGWKLSKDLNFRKAHSLIIWLSHNVFINSLLRLVAYVQFYSDN